MNRFMAKVNGAAHCPNGICRPEQARDWEGEPIEVLKKTSPRTIDTPDRKGVPGVEAGDEIWIWTHEHRDYGHGRGLTAVANASEAWIEGNSLKIRLQEVELIARPVALADFGRLKSGSRMISRLQASRRPDIYYFDDEAFAEFKVVVDTRRVLNATTQADWGPGVILRNRVAIDEEFNSQHDIPLALRPSRPGQQAFRERLMRIYGGRCVVTGCAIACAVEAAHIVPYTGDDDLERPENGLILRRDIHGLFDAGLISIDPSTSRVTISEDLEDTEYSALAGNKVCHFAAPAFLQFRHDLFRKRLDEGAALAQ